MCIYIYLNRIYSDVGKQLLKRITREQICTGSTTSLTPWCYTFLFSLFSSWLFSILFSLFSSLWKWRWRWNRWWSYLNERRWTPMPQWRNLNSLVLLPLSVPWMLRSRDRWTLKVDQFMISCVDIILFPSRFFNPLLVTVIRSLLSLISVVVIEWHHSNLWWRT